MTFDRSNWNRRVYGFLLAAALLGAGLAVRATSGTAWMMLAGDPQHTAVSTVASQPLQTIRWTTPVDLFPPSGVILIHYGSPLATPGNTIIVPVKTGATGGFRVEAHNGQTGAIIWSQSTDYVLPPHHWTPSYSPALTAGNRLYFAGAGGTIYFRDNPDSSSSTSGQVAFFGMSDYLAKPDSFNATVFIDTPITSDSLGNIYFGFRTSGTAPLGLQSGVARINASGNGTWVSAASMSGGDVNVDLVPHQAAPALSNDEQTLYAVVSSSSSTKSYLVGLDASTLAVKQAASGAPMRVALTDPRNGGVNNAVVSDDSSASPVVGPDGDVYYGVLGNPSNGSRGWMLHFSGDLTQTKIPGAFGWDSTPSIVPASMVPSYTGSSSYLLFTKYNNYAGLDDGDGVNEIAVLDPNATMVERHASSNGLPVMKEVLTIAGPTPDPDHINQYPNAVREWCINTAAVDPLTQSVMANSEDGKLYRWDLSTNTLSEAVTLNAGRGEAYTSTIIGPDGTVYAINGAVLNAVGRVANVTLQSLTISPLNPGIFVNSTLQFAATGHYSDGSTRDLTSTAAWSSSKPSVATITASGGVASGRAKGTTTIRAAAGGFSASTTLTVNSLALQSITVTPATAAISVGGSQQFRATGTYTNGSTSDLTSTVTWSSSPKPVASIGSSGLATGLKTGTATVTAKSTGVSGSATLTVR